MKVPRFRFKSSLWF